MSKLPPAAAVLTALAFSLTVMSFARARTVAYVSNADSHEIYVLELNEDDGQCRVVEKVPVGGGVMPLAISPDHKFLYAASPGKPCPLSRFAIDSDRGTLTPVDTVLLADSMVYLSVDHAGRYLFAASYDGDKVSVNRLGPGGEVSPQPLAVIATGQRAHCVVIDPSNRFLFATNLGDDRIQAFRFDARTGEITPNSPPAVSTRRGAGPRHLAFHPNGRFVFGLNELDASVDTYRLEPSGTLTLLGSRSILPDGFAGSPRAADLHLTPDGRFLYASERTSNTLAAFRVNGDTGELSLPDHYPTESQPRGFNIDPAGKYLLAVGQKSNGLTAYEIDRQSGVLRPCSHLEVGKNPNWVEIITLPR